MKEILKKNQAITLVSLVVTIIILIILAGVSINLTLGENGIITKSKQAKEKTEQAKLNEEVALNELYMQIETEGGSISYDSIAKLTEFKKAIADYIEEAGGVKPEYTADTMTFRDSIKGIVKEVTKDATATEEDIAEGKTAWVNGSLITGNAASSKTPKFIGFFYYRYNIAGAYFIYNTESNTIGINSKTCDNFKFVDSSDVETIQILKSGYFDIIATGKGAEQYKLMNQYIEANTTYSVPCGNYAGGEGMIVIYSY